VLDSRQSTYKPSVLYCFMIFFTLLSCFASRLHFSMLVSSHAVTVLSEPCCEHWSIVVEAVLAVMSLAIWFYVITTYRFYACTCNTMYSFHYYADLASWGAWPPKSAIARRGWPRRNFMKMFDAGKTRMIGLPYGEKSMTIR